jgi:hypothetical protein
LRPVTGPPTRQLTFTFYRFHRLSSQYFGPDAPPRDQVQAQTDLRVSLTAPTAKALPEWMMLLYGEHPWLPWRLSNERTKVRAREYARQGATEAALAQYRKTIQLREENSDFFEGEFNVSSAWSSIGEGLARLPAARSTSLQAFEEAMRTAHTEEDLRRAQLGFYRAQRGL